jgi:hypothetical protein
MEHQKDFLNGLTYETHMFSQDEPIALRTQANIQGLFLTAEVNGVYQQIKHLRCYINDRYLRDQSHVDDEYVAYKDFCQFFPDRQLTFNEWLKNRVYGIKLFKINNDVVNHIELFMTEKDPDCTITCYVLHNDKNEKGFESSEWQNLDSSTYNHQNNTVCYRTLYLLSYWILYKSAFLKVYVSSKHDNVDLILKEYAVRLNNVKVNIDKNVPYCKYDIYENKYNDETKEYEWSVVIPLSLIPIFNEMNDPIIDTMFNIKFVFEETDKLKVNGSSLFYKRICFTPSKIDDLYKQLTSDNGYTQTFEYLENDIPITTVINLRTGKVITTRDENT